MDLSRNLISYLFSGGTAGNGDNQVIILEIPAATGAMVNAPSAYHQMLGVVQNVTVRFAPGA